MPQEVSFRRAPFPFNPGPALAVAAVLTDDPPTAGQARWQFDGTVTLTAPVVVGLRVFVDGVWKDPLAAYQLAEDFVIYCIYDTAQTLDGKAWEIVVTPSGIEQAGRIVLPESGTVVAP